MTGSGAYFLPSGVFALGTSNYNLNFDGSNITLYINNGSYMKVQGSAFGSSNQFIEWYGVSKSPANNFQACTESNAIYYLKVDGGAYFGGTLLAGRLTNAVQATVLNTSNVADLGPFSSNGGQITITYSYEFVGRIDYPATTSGVTDYNAQTKQNPSAVLILSRSINGGSFSDVYTWNINNGSHSEEAPVVADLSPGFYQQQMSGSGTYLDPDTIAQNREYKLRIDSWTNVNTTVVANIQSLQSLE
jgi:hypothetical protein